MLDSLLISHRAQLDALADAWLALGAEAIWLQQAEDCLAIWPQAAQVEQPTLQACMRIHGQTLGCLCVCGQGLEPLQARLQADVNWLQEILQLETELESLTVDLIDTQDQLLALYDLTQSTRNHLDLEALVHSLAREATRLLKVEAAFVYLVPPDRLPLLLTHPAPVLPKEQIAHLFNEVRLQERPLLREDLPPNLNWPENLDTILLHPVYFQGRVGAVLGFINKALTSFISPDIKLAAAIADQIGAQIENVLLHQEALEQTKFQTQMEMAQRVQQLLIPGTFPEVLGLDVAAGLRHASQVGGDFYDFIVQPEKPFKFVVGDVSGKGMPAALIMSMSRMVLRTSAKFTPTPEAALSRANMDMYDEFTEIGMFATIFIGAYDHEAQEITYANAGHSPVIYCPKGGPAAIVEADGTAMGVLPDSLSRNQALPFQPGDLLIVATDGFSEASNPQGEMFGYDRLLALSESLARLSATEIVETMFRTIFEFQAGYDQDDDQTLLVIKGVPS